MSFLTIFPRSINLNKNIAVQLHFATAIDRKFIELIVAMTWNKRYEQFALSLRLRQSVERLLRWILRRSKPNEIVEIEIDLRIFNRFIQRDRGKPYDRKTIKQALALLVGLSQGLVIIQKTYTWAVHKIIVRPLSVVMRNNSQNGENSPKLATGNPMFSNESKKRAIEQQQQNISKLDNLFRRIGLTYSRDALARIWRLAGKSMVEVCNSIELLLHRHNFGKSEIGNAHGFIIKSLKQGWYYESELCKPADLPEFDSITDLVTSVNRLRGNVMKCQT